MRSAQGRTGGWPSSGIRMNIVNFVICIFLEICRRFAKLVTQIHKVNTILSTGKVNKLLGCRNYTAFCFGEQNGGRYFFTVASWIYLVRINCAMTGISELEQVQLGCHVECRSLVRREARLSQNGTGFGMVKTWRWSEGFVNSRQKTTWLSLANCWNTRPTLLAWARTLQKLCVR